MRKEKQSLAVIGTGVAGLTVAYLLKDLYSVTLYEKEDYIGGHTHTIVIPEGEDEGTPVDTGFIVMNHKNYPLFTRLLEKLDVPLRDSDMSFGYACEKSGLQYAATSLNALFAQRKNLLNFNYFRMIRDILRFHKTAQQALQGGLSEDVTLGEFLKSHAFGDYFIHHHILPMGAAIWSTPCDTMMEFPALSFFRFFNNHGLLSVSDQPQWRTVVGGSHAYVKKILSEFEGNVYESTPVVSVKRGKQIEVVSEGKHGGTRHYDHVVLAAHADQTFNMLLDPSGLEKDCLSPWQYNKNTVVLHTDSSVMPDNPRAWASWNYTREVSAEQDNMVSLSYDMNRLQGLKTHSRYFVTLNRKQPIKEDRIVFETVYTHPVYTRESMGTQRMLADLNKNGSTWFCGSYFGYGFHEDAVRSAVNVVKKLGGEL